jgi:hypothetical protein
MTKKPKQKTKQSASALVTAQDLIAGANGRSKTAHPPAAALKELRKLCEYNDAQNNRAKRVGWRGACELLKSHGLDVGAAPTLDKVCREHLKRTSYATP